MIENILLIKVPLIYKHFETSLALVIKDSIKINPTKMKFFQTKLLKI